MGRRWPGKRNERTPQTVWAEWEQADDAGDTDRACTLAEEMLTLTPDSSLSWFHAGLLSKALGRWEEASARNSRAVDLFTPRDAEMFDGVNPAAWNLGISSTALGDWSTARRAWRAYGIEVIPEGGGPIDSDLGMTPVRINPEDPSLPHQVLPGLGATEVIWCWRRSPAHGVIASVPLPESGHRFRDVVLHDGEPRGSRMTGGQEVSVFDELALLESLGIPTWQAQLVGADRAELAALADLLGPRGLGVDEWSGIRMLCADCSMGSPDSGHSHEPAPEGATRLGLAGDADALRSALDEWLDAHQHVVLDLELLG